MAYVSGLVTEAELAAIRDSGYEFETRGEWSEGDLTWVDLTVDCNVTDLLLPALCPFCMTLTTMERSKERDATISTCHNCKAKIVIVRGNV